MAYQRLALVDYESRWTTAEVAHIEQGIIDVENELAKKQTNLASGVNIKTIDNRTILGEGNLSLRDLGYLTPEDIIASDWNDNDPNSATYIKNRPFYSTYTPVVLQDTITVDVTPAGSRSISIYSLIEEGKFYRITFNNQVFYSTAKISNGGWLGNGYLISEYYPDSLEPYGVSFSTEGNLTRLSLYSNVSGICSFKLEEMTDEQVVKIPKKYIPEDIAADSMPKETILALYNSIL